MNSGVENVKTPINKYDTNIMVLLRMNEFLKLCLVMKFLLSQLNFFDYWEMLQYMKY